MNPLNHIYRPGSGAATVCMGHPGADEAPPFPMECFPPAMADMARAIAHTERTPETLAGCCILGIVSASIGAGHTQRSSREQSPGWDHSSMRGAVMGGRVGRWWVAVAGSTGAFIE